MELEDTVVLFSRNGRLYKSTIFAFFSQFFTKKDKEDIIEEIASLSSKIEYLNSKNFLDANFYTKEETDAKFLDKQSMDSFLENEEYVKLTVAISESQKLCAEANISAWRVDQHENYCAKILGNAYEYVKTIGGGSKTVDSADRGSYSDSLALPNDYEKDSKRVSDLGN